MVSVNYWTYMFEPPGPTFSDSDNTKLNWSEMSGIPDLDDFPLNHEVLGDIAYFTGPFTNTEPINYEVKFYNDNTGKLLYSRSYQIPTPASQGWEWWNWVKVKSWIGHASWEIDRPMKVRIEIRVTGWIFNESRTLYMDVIYTTPPEFTEDEVTDNYTIHAYATTFPDQFDFDIISIPSGADIFMGTMDTGWDTPLYGVGVGGPAPTWVLKKDGFADLTIPIPERFRGFMSTITANLPLFPTGIRCDLGSEYSVPSGTHPFNIWVLYGTDVDGTYENFASTGSYQWASGGQINVWSPGQSVVTNIDLTNITLPSGTYDALTIIIDGINTSIVHDWKIDNDVLVV